MSVYVLRGGKEEMERKRAATCCVYNVCICVCPCGGRCVCVCVCVLGGENALPASLNLLKQQKAGSPRTLPVEAPYPHEHGTDTSGLQMLAVRYRPQD